MVKPTCSHKAIERIMFNCTERHIWRSTLCGSFGVIVFLLLKETSSLVATFVTGVKLKYRNSFTSELLPEVESNEQELHEITGLNANSSERPQIRTLLTKFKRLYNAFLVFENRGCCGKRRANSGLFLFCRSRRS